MSILYPFQIPASNQLIRALTHGQQEWGYPGAVDLSDVGVGKSFIDLNAGLSIGRKVVVLSPLAGFNGWLQTFKAFNAEPHYVGTPDGLKQGNRSHIVKRMADGSFVWQNAGDIMLILDEAQHFKGMDSIASRLADGAIAQNIPMICASATLASSPLELRIAGRITGLHRDGHDWERFMVEYGCRYVDEETGWQWNKKRYLLEQLHHILIPQRGCRVTKAMMGDRPGSTIEVLPIECEEGPGIEREWARGNTQIAEMTKKQYPKMVLIGIRRKIRMRLWKLCEQALVPHVADLMKQDLEDGKSVLGFFTFTDTREEMGRLLKTKDGFYGGQPAHLRASLADAFQADRIRVLLNQIKAGGSAVNLHDVRGDHPRVSYIFPSDSGVAMEQAPGRTDRSGMKSHAQVWIPCVAGTLSEAMTRSTARKILAMNALNDGGTRV